MHDQVKKQKNKSVNKEGVTGRGFSGGYREWGIQDWGAHWPDQWGVVLYCYIKIYSVQEDFSNHI